MIDATKPPCFYCKDENHAMIDCPKYNEERKISEAIRNEWYDNHKCCPKCKSKHTIQTLAGPIHIMGQPFEDNVNSAQCFNCDWKGMVKDLVPEASQTT